MSEQPKENSLLRTKSTILAEAATMNYQQIYQKVTNDEGGDSSISCAG